VFTLTFEFFDIHFQLALVNQGSDAPLSCIIQHRLLWHY